MSSREAPPGYEWPGADALAARKTSAYWMARQADWAGATPLFMIMCADSDGQHILAEKAYLRAGVMIVDALRAAA